MSIKGFTLIEVLLVLLISSLVLLITPSLKIPKPYIDIELFESNVIHHQFMAILNHKEITFESNLSTIYPIRFSAIGNIHFPQTIQINESELVISLGPGRIYEKSEYID